MKITITIEDDPKNQSPDVSGILVGVTSVPDMATLPKDDAGRPVLTPAGQVANAALAAVKVMLMEVDKELKNEPPVDYSESN